MDLPEPHRRLLEEMLPRIREDPRIVGVAVAGSLANGHPDEHSDVDLVLAVDDDRYEAVLPERLGMIASWTSLVAGFTGEHVGEPRVIISIVGPPLLHVDVKFVRCADVGSRVDRLVVLWERDDRVSAALAARPPAPPRLDLQWIEDRFWVWVHYGATKLARGELYETIGFLAFLRETVLGPLICHLSGAPLQGVRKLERVDPDRATRLRATLCDDDRADAARALLACVDLYRAWRDETGLSIVRNREAERLAVGFLRESA